MVFRTFQTDVTNFTDFPSEPLGISGYLSRTKVSRTATRVSILFARKNPYVNLALPVKFVSQIHDGVHVSSAELTEVKTAAVVSA